MTKTNDDIADIGNTKENKKNSKENKTAATKIGFLANSSLHIVPILFIIGATIILITFYVGMNITFRNKAHNVGKMR